MSGAAWLLPDAMYSVLAATAYRPGFGAGCWRLPPIVRQFKQICNSPSCCVNSVDNTPWVCSMFCSRFTAWDSSMEAQNRYYGRDAFQMMRVEAIQHANRYEVCVHV
mmetsp:Transcript_37375/g.61430  ORF Transcript_37375/g.61430 Transcript_37375/m.61430 type:complete len:107 (-) Transcript_37375:305-625(-)